MLLYDWKKIVRHSGGDPNRVILIIRSMMLTSMPQSRKDPLYRYYYKDFSGQSFLNGAGRLISNAYKYSPKEVADYIGLASFRNTGEFLQNNKLTLDLAHSPMGKDALTQNRLLRIEDKDIHFIYEDYKEK